MAPIAASENSDPNHPDHFMRPTPFNSSYKLLQNRITTIPLEARSQFVPGKIGLKHLFNMLSRLTEKTSFLWLLVPARLKNVTTFSALSAIIFFAPALNRNSCQLAHHQSCCVERFFANWFEVVRLGCELVRNYFFLDSPLNRNPCQLARRRSYCVERC